MRSDPWMRGVHHDGMQLLYFVRGLEIEATPQTPHVPGGHVTRVFWEQEIVSCR